MRLFIAIPIEDELKTPLVDFQERIQITQADIRLVQSENIHLTLRFLGEVDEKIVPSITGLMKKTVSGYQSVEAELNSIGAFPTVSSPRVIWVGCREISMPDNLSNPCPTTRSIYQGIEDGLINLGLAPDDHSFSPHITLARVKSSKNRDKLVNLLKEKSDFYIGKQSIKEIVLFQSQLHPTGPVYSIVYSAALQEK